MIMEDWCILNKVYSLQQFKLLNEIVSHFDRSYTRKKIPDVLRQKSAVQIVKYRCLGPLALLCKFQVAYDEDSMTDFIS